MVKLEVLEPILQLLNDEDMQGKVEELARFFYSNGNITVNLLPALILGVITIFFVLPLLGIPLLDSVLGTVGGAAAGYNTVAYAGAPTTAYGGQPSAYGTGYSARSNQVELTEEQKVLYPELAELRDKIVELQESEYNLRSQLYYNTVTADSGLGNTVTNHINYTY